MLSIWNGALALLGAELLTAETDPSSRAQQVRALWAMVRDEAVRAYPWNCCMARALVGPDAEGAVWGGLSRWRLPGDCLRVMQVDGDLSGLEWQVEGPHLLTAGSAAIRLRYLRRPEVITDPALALYLSIRLAAVLAVPLTGNASTASAMEAMARQQLLQARAVDAQEAVRTETVTADAWVQARG